jgi:hypothetical protein
MSFWAKFKSFVQTSIFSVYLYKTQEHWCTATHCEKRGNGKTCVGGRLGSKIRKI